MRLFSVFLLIFCFYSCSNPSPDFTTVEVEEVFSDSLHAIRDLQARDETNIWFSAGDGRIGVLQEGVPKIASVRYNETALKFKSIAVQDSVVSLLHPTRSVLVYKLDYDQESARNLASVYIQEAPEVFYTALAFWHVDKGIIVGERQNSSCLAIIRTMDGGETWNEISCDAFSELEKGGLVFAFCNSNLNGDDGYGWIPNGGKKDRLF